MKKLLLFIIILLAAFSALNAQPQPPDTLWTKTFGWGGYESGSDVRQTSDGGYIITGYTNTGLVYPDVLLIKTDEQGNQEWNHIYGFFGSETGQCVQQTSVLSTFKCRIKAV